MKSGMLVGQAVVALSVMGVGAIEVAPSEIVEVKGEKLKLSANAPRVWAEGTKLRQLQTIRPGVGTPAPGAVVPDSIEVRRGESVLIRDQDYLFDPVWGSLGIGPSGKVTPADEVSVDYRYSLLRIDSLVRTADGQELVRQGKSDLNCPVPPELAPGDTHLANLYVPYHSDGKNAEVFTVTETVDKVKTASTPGRIPRTLAKIRAGGPVKVVCWGDSVTEGGDVSKPEFRYPNVFAAMLKERYPDGNITVETIAVGGSNSQQWLYPEKHPFPNPARREHCRWERVAEAKPDLVTVEFVNDAGLDAAGVERVYNDILGRVQALGAEIILITPHFTMPSMMGFKSVREAERRPYVLALRKYAEARGLALADASARWEHLAAEGVPYPTLLRNGINHPDDRGHRLFAEELLKCFAD